MTGYPPEDLLLKPHFLRRARASLRRLARATRGLTAIIGGVDPRPEGAYNAAGIFQNGRRSRSDCRHQRLSLPRREVEGTVVIRLVDRSEYKRRQSPPGIKITPKSFGRDRRMPITNRYSEK